MWKSLTGNLGSFRYVYRRYAGSLCYNFASDAQVFLHVFSKQIVYLVKKKLLDKKFGSLIGLLSQASSVHFTKKSFRVKFDPAMANAPLIKELYELVSGNEMKFSPYHALSSLQSCQLNRKHNYLDVRYSLIPSKIYGSIAFLNLFLQRLDI